MDRYQRIREGLLSRGVRRRYVGRVVRELQDHDRDARESGHPHFPEDADVLVDLFAARCSQFSLARTRPLVYFVVLPIITLIAGLIALPWAWGTLIETTRFDRIAGVLFVDAMSATMTIAFGINAILHRCEPRLVLLCALPGVLAACISASSHTTPAAREFSVMMSANPRLATIAWTGVITAVLIAAATHCPQSPTKAGF